MNRHRLVALASLLCVALAAPAVADQQTKAQQGCLTKVNKAARKIAGAVLKDASLCVRKGAKGQLPMGVSAQQCLSADLKGKVAKARAKVTSTIASSCAEVPDFGLTDTTTIGDGYVVDNVGLSIDSFGSDLDATLAASAGVDPAGKCSSTLPGALRKLEDAMHKEFEGCLKRGLKDGTVIDAATMEACLNSVTADVRGRVLKAAGTLESLLTVKCPAGDLVGLFPGLSSICAVYGDTTTATGIASCGIERVECRLCRIVDTAYGLDRDCDLYDDNTANGSCPDCGNTVVDAGEGCDDGNEVSGDGCTALCVDEFCGDGSINDNGTEVCDNGGANSDVTPNACRTDCSNPTCGDAVTDTGEECDDGNLDEDDGCTSACTSCGNGNASGPEACDDGNNVDGDCCAADCSFESYGSTCTGPPSGECTAPGCDGAGACAELPANETDPCDDGEECTATSECQSGTCTATSYVVTGVACTWLAVANPSGPNQRRIDVENGADLTGDLCSNFGIYGQNTVTIGDIVTTMGDNVTPALEFNSFANVDAGDIITDNARVTGTGGIVTLPGVGVASIAAGQNVSKTPSPTFYDTTGTDPRVADCAAAQAAISTSTAGLLDGLPATANLGAVLTGVAGGSSHTINAVNVGALNVFDLTNITGGNGVTLHLDGGGDPDTVFILRIATSLNTQVGWTFSLDNGLTANHLLIYSKGATNSRCELGSTTTGGGTLFCPNGRAQILQDSVWEGAVFGGGDTDVAILIGGNVQLTHTRFTGF